MAKRCKVFAYGSNLSHRQMLSRCPGAAIEDVAVLAGHELAFSGWSGYRRGGVATVRPVTGRDVPGVVYSLTEADLLRLDGWESVPTCYERRKVTVQTAGGQQRVWAYFRLAAAVDNPPADQYFDLIWQAYEDAGWGLESLAEAAAACGAGWHLVFVYGSLLRGLGNHRILADGGARLVCETSTAEGYGMWSLGCFPAVRRLAGGGPIKGEVWLADDATLRALDRLEGHPAFYRREPVGLECGLTAAAYFYQRSCTGLDRVAQGCWRSFFQKRS